MMRRVISTCCDRPGVPSAACVMWCDPRAPAETCGEGVGVLPATIWRLGARGSSRNDCQGYRNPADHRNRS
jgi:hypothetical protein